ncbi:MAG: CYTH domain-containing protein [Truepera sp.]|nr:CYTH domain-containing protein [Truepera sp.]
MKLEREHKFSLDAAELPDPWVLKHDLALAGFELLPEGKHEQRDRYLDTPDRRLKQAGLAMRERRIGQRRLVTLKWAGSVTGALHQRQELELETSGWPPEVLAALPEGVAVTDLAVQLELTTQRTRFLVMQQACPEPGSEGSRGAGRRGVALAELALDEVSAHRPGHDVSIHFLEVELEALSAGADELARLAAALQELLPLAESSVSKLERATALLEAAPAQE